MSDSSQGPGWWQATDGKWYPPEQLAGAAAPTDAPPTAPEAAVAPEQPPAPGWWKASDGNWYPPAGETPTAAPTSDVAATSEAAPSAAAPAYASAPAAGPAAPGRSSSGAKPLLVIGGVFVVLVLIAAGIFVARRGSDGTTGGTGANTANGSGTGNDGGNGNDGGSGTAGGPGPLPATNDVLPDTSITLTDDVVVVRSNGGAAVKSLGDDGKTITIDAAAEGADKLEPGKILLLTGVTVVKVSSVDKNDQDLTITAEPVTLPEVIKDGEITWNDQPVVPKAVRLVAIGGGCGSDGGGGDGEGTDDGSGIDINGPLTGGVIRPPVMGDGESAAGFIGETARIPTKTISGKAADFTFDITHEAEGSGHHLNLKLKSDGEVKGTIETDVHIRSLANSGHVKVEDQALQNFDFTMADLGGTATITGDLQGLSDVAKVSTPPFFKLPFSIEFPMPLGGIPFTMSLTGTIQVTAVFSIGNSSLQGRAEITYDGDAGFHFKSGNVTLDGKRTQEAPDLLKTLKGVTPGPVGMVFTTELPKIGFGFGFLQTGAGIYLSSGMVASQTILPPPAICTAENIAYVLAGGVEAKFLGKEFEIARKAFVKKEWNYQQPTNARCNAPK
jgi:hypothetical protein